jgi:ATP-dependent Clp protease ATP-binding subunit ClpA
MFERYTEKAQRVIFFARYEASQFGSPYIETEHLLLGLLREDKALTFRFLRSHASVESIRKQIEGHITIREKLSTSVDLPLSNATHTSTLRNNLVCGHAVQRHIVRQTYARLALPFVVCWHSVQENTSLSPVHSFLALPYATLSRRS